MNVSASRNMFDNRLDRFEDNRTGDENARVFRSQSQEIENKLRLDVNRFLGKWEYSYGAVLQYVKYSNDFFSVQRRPVVGDGGTIVTPGSTLRFDTAIDFFKYGAFVQATRKLADDRLTLSGGLRMDMNSFTDSGNNPLKTLSPRASLSYQLNEKWRINGSLGRYYKVPIYTVLGFRERQPGFEPNYQLTNRDSEYIRSDHAVLGVEFVPRVNTRITVEVFNKQYANYPVSVRQGISLANQGGEFGAIGNENVTSTGEGRSRGVEFFIQQKLVGNFFGVLSYTLFESEFTGADGVYRPSAWDTRHLVSTQLGYKLKRGWEIGGKFLFQGGAPYTPFDLSASQQNYAVLGTGTLDNDRLNADRLRPFNRFDLRVDKKWNARRFSVDAFIDIQNLFLTKNPAFPQFTFERKEDNSGFATTDGAALSPNGSNAIPLILRNEDATVTPALGLVVEF